MAQLVKNLPAMWETWVQPLVGKMPWRRERLPTPVFWPGKFHGLVHGVAKSWLRLNDFHFTSLHMVTVVNNSMLLCSCCIVSDSFATPWTIAHQAPLSMGFPRQEYWSGLHFLTQGIFLTQELNLRFLHWQADSLLLSH